MPTHRERDVHPNSIVLQLTITLSLKRSHDDKIRAQGFHNNAARVSRNVQPGNAPAGLPQQPDLATRIYTGVS